MSGQNSTHSNATMSENKIIRENLGIDTLVNLRPCPSIHFSYGTNPYGKTLGMSGLAYIASVKKSPTLLIIII